MCSKLLKIYVLNGFGTFEFNVFSRKRFFYNPGVTAPPDLPNQSSALSDTKRRDAVTKISRSFPNFACQKVNVLMGSVIEIWRQARFVTFDLIIIIIILIRILILMIMIMTMIITGHISGRVEFRFFIFLIFSPRNSPTTNIQYIHVQNFTPGSIFKTPGTENIQ